MKKILSITLVLTLIFSLSSCAKSLKKLSSDELFDLGKKYLLDMDYEQAVAYFDRLIEIEPRNPNGYMGLARAYVGLKDADGAISALQSGVAKLPDNEDFLTKVMDIYESIIDQSPGSVGAYAGIAEIYVELGYYDKAIEILQHGFDITSDSRLREMLDRLNNERGADTIVFVIGNPDMVINGTKTRIDNVGGVPFSSDGVVMVPLRGVIEAFDGAIDYDNGSLTAHVTCGDKTMALVTGADEAAINGESVNINAAPQIIGAALFAPLRAISIMLNAELEWDGASQKVTMTVPGRRIDITALKPPSPVGTIAIISVTPDRVKERKMTEFTVTVQYTSNWTESRVINFGANTEESGRYNILAEHVADDTEGTFTFTFATTPVLWSDGSFGIFAELADSSGTERKQPLASAVFDVEVTADMYTAYLNTINNNRTHQPNDEMFEDAVLNLSGGGLLDFDNDGVEDLALFYSAGGNMYQELCAVYSFKDGEVRQLFDIMLSNGGNWGYRAVYEKNGVGSILTYDHPSAVGGAHAAGGYYNSYLVYRDGALREELVYGMNAYFNNFSDYAPDHVEWEILRKGVMTKFGVVDDYDAYMPEIDAVEAEAKSTYGTEWSGMKIDNLKAKLAEG